MASLKAYNVHCHCTKEFMHSTVKIIRVPVRNVFPQYARKTTTASQNFPNSEINFDKTKLGNNFMFVKG